MTGRADFFKLADVATDQIVSRINQALGTDLPIEKRRTSVYRDLQVVALFCAASGGEGDATESRVLYALGNLAVWRTELPPVDSLLLAAECRIALEKGKPVSFAQVGALTGRGRTCLWRYVKGGERRGRMLSANAARVLVATFRTEAVFRSWAKPTATGGIGMLERIRKVPEEGVEPPT